MKHIKVAVPDDFNEDADWTLVNYTEDGARGHVAAKIWQPEYREILDCGYIGLVDFMGDDNSVVQAARVSYGRGTKRKNSDRGLVRYLMRNRHTTPFEMVTLKWHVKAPIFVFRQWHRHRTASINEYSGRYSVLDNDMYIPEHAQATPQSHTNNQGRQDTLLSDQHYLGVQAALDNLYDVAYQSYKYLLGPIVDENGDPILKDGKFQYPDAPDGINMRKLWAEESAVKGMQKLQQQENMLASEEGREPHVYTQEEIDAKVDEYFEANGLAFLDGDYPGLAKELARLPLPVGTYSQMYWQANLHNTFHFIGLRSDPHAQWEIRQYSDAMLEMMEPYIPWAVEAFKDYRLNGTSVSALEKDFIKLMMKHAPEVGWDYDALSDWMKTNGASKREIDEFWKKFLD